MKKVTLTVKVVMLLAVMAIAFSSCSKKTCPAYASSQVNQTEANKA